jgi:hypothetical protein
MLHRARILDLEMKAYHCQVKVEKGLREYMPRWKVPVTM